jgi:hypothetical protein
VNEEEGGKKEEVGGGEREQGGVDFRSCIFVFFLYLLSLLLNAPTAGFSFCLLAVLFYFYFFRLGHVFGI